MAFSSVHFLFFFLPIVLAVYFILGKRYRNLWLLLASFFFYFWGERSYTFILLVSVAANYLFGICIEKTRGKPSGKAVITLSVILNLGIFGYFKYGNFIAENINRVFSFFGGEAVPPPIFGPWIHYPLGLSFFTLMSLSYLFDVYRGDASALKNPVSAGLYISFFPRIIAGPIIRYRDEAALIGDRSMTRENFARGVSRFIIGFGKKVLIADTVAIAADRIFALSAGELTTTLAWAGILCFAVQFYFEFSGFTDMAIGLGQMFGFAFPENFRHPFAALSIREHWRRWHITFVNWIREYLYIPLGGNRGSAFRTYLNLMIVFIAAGFWHGAGWNFLAWGLWNGLFIALERAGIIKVDKFRFRPLQWLYAMLVILIGYVIFRTDSLAKAFPYLSAMSGFANGNSAEHHILFYMQVDTMLAFIFGVIGSAPVCPYLDEKIISILSRKDGRFNSYCIKLYHFVRILLLISILGFSIIRLSAGAFIRYSHVLY